LLTFRSLDELVATPNVAPLGAVEDKINELKTQYQEDLELFTAFQSAEYRQEVLDKYNSIDNSITGVNLEDQIQVDYLAALSVRLPCLQLR